MIAQYNGADRKLAYLFENAREVSFSPILTTGTQIATLTIDDQTYTLYCTTGGGGGGGGSTVSYNSLLSSGTALGELTIDGITYTIYSKDSSKVAYSATQTSGTQIGTLTIDGTPHILYAPNSGGGSEIDGRNTFGVFIDTSKIIVSTTIFRTDTSYTATEDCAVVVGVPTSANAESVIKINNVKVGAIYSQSGITAAYDTFFVKKGQTITIEPSYTQGDSTYTVYGLTFGTQNVFAPQIYSLSERQVGVWTDGKPLYQKTYEFTMTSAGNNIVLDSTLTLDRIQLVDSVVSYKRSADGYYTSPMLASVVTRLFCSSNGIEIERNGYDSWMGTVNGVATIKYTKVADTAGSGNWTPDGVPAVHYSTDEHVVGTWVDGKTLYQKTIVTNAQVVLSDNSWKAVPFASGDVPSDADTMFCTECFTSTDSHLIYDNRTRFIYDNGVIKGATSQTGGQNVPAGLTLTIRYTKAS